MLEPGELEQIKKAGEETIQKAVESTASAFKQEIQTHIAPIKEDVQEVKDSVLRVTTKVGEIDVLAHEAKQKAVFACGEANEAKKKSERIAVAVRADIQAVETRTEKKIKDESKWARYVFYAVIGLLIEEIVRNFILTPLVMNGHL